jgi:rod shape-determining protein MreC
MAVTRRASQRLTLVMLVLASITVITLDYRGDARSTIASLRNGARDVVSPIQHVISDILHPVGDFFSGAVNYGAARNENQVLQAENGRLRRQIAEAGVAEQQLSQLLSQLHLPFVENLRTVRAQVIDEAPSNFDVEIEIDQGTGDGIGKGMPVVAGPGLVGSIVSAGVHTAMVRLLTDPHSSVGVRFGKNEFAVVVGQGPTNPLALQFVQSGESVHAGEVVTTSGLLGAAFPADIPVGTVTAVQSTPGAYTQVASVTPYVDFSVLQYVTVLQWLPPA